MTRDGERIDTLIHAANYILALPESVQQRGLWQHATKRHVHRIQAGPCSNAGRMMSTQPNPVAVILQALEDAQAVVARYIDPGATDRSAQATVDALMPILESRQLREAMTAMGYVPPWLAAEAAHGDRGRERIGSGMTCCARL